MVERDRADDAALAAVGGGESAVGRLKMPYDDVNTLGWLTQSKNAR